MKPHTRLFVIVFTLTLILDQVTKAWAREAGDWLEGRSLSALPWPGVFELKLVYNEGIAFGMMQGIGPYLAPLAILVSALAFGYSLKNPTEPRVVHATAALLASGAIGNLIDRLWMGKVTDMFWFRAINFPVFNIADVCISIAGTLMVLGALKDLVSPKKAIQPASSEASSSPPPTSQA